MTAYGPHSLLFSFGSRSVPLICLLHPCFLPFDSGLQGVFLLSVFSFLYSFIFSPVVGPAYHFVARTVHIPGRSPLRPHCNSRFHFHVAFLRFTRCLSPAPIRRPAWSISNGSFCDNRPISNLLLQKYFRIRTLCHKSPFSHHTSSMSSCLCPSAARFLSCLYAR